MPDKLKFDYHIVNEADARQFLTWRYEAPYDIYNYDSADFERDLAYHIDPKNNLFSLMLDADLAGYCSYGRDAQVPGGDYSEDALDIGMMIRPDLTGQGKGTQFAASVITYGVDKFKPKILRVTIADFNKRAMRVWEKLGFERMQEFGRTNDGKVFVIFTRAA